MKLLTEKTMRQALAMDGEVSAEDVERAIAILNGCPETHHDLVRVLRYDEVMKRLNVTREGLKYYIRMGYLDRVFGSGSRAIGISQESYRRFTSRRVEPAAKRDREIA